VAGERAGRTAFASDFTASVAVMYAKGYDLPVVTDST
jgi:hypothetical protein